MKQNKLETKLEFSFDDQEEVPVFDVNMNVKTNKKKKHIKIIEHKKKIVDVSTKLF